MALQQGIELNEYTLGDDFTKYKSKKLLSLVDPLTSIKYGVAGAYNYIYIADDATYSFLNKPVKKAAFKVEDDKITELMIFIDTPDIDEFYSEVTKKFGQPEIARISSTYLHRYGYKPPTELNTGLDDAHLNMPEPKINDFRYLNGVSWFDFNDKLDKAKFETSMHVRNEARSNQEDKSGHTMIIRFKIFDLIKSKENNKEAPK